MHCVLIIVIERHLTLTLTSDHIHNARNAFLRSDLYEKGVITHASSCIIKSYDLAFTGAAMLDFDELQQFPKNCNWATLLKRMPDQQFMEHLNLHLNLRHLHHHRKLHIQGLNKHKGDI